VPSPISEPADDLPPTAHKASKRDLPALSDNDENNIPLPKGKGKMGPKMAKGDKGKGKGKATDPGKEIGTDQNHDRKNVPTKPKKSVLSHPILIMSLLTLDETTLFYYFLSNSKKKYADFSTGINHPKNSKPASKVASAAGSQSITSIYSGPPLTNATTRSSGTSALSKNIKVS